MRDFFTFTIKQEHMGNKNSPTFLLWKQTTSHRCNEYGVEWGDGHIGVTHHFTNCSIQHPRKYGKYHMNMNKWIDAIYIFDVIQTKLVGDSSVPLLNNNNNNTYIYIAKYPANTACSTHLMSLLFVVFSGK